MDKKFEIQYKSVDETYIEDGVKRYIIHKMNINSFKTLPHHIIFETEDCGTIILRSKDVLAFDEIKSKKKKVT